MGVENLEFFFIVIYLIGKLIMPALNEAERLIN